MSYEYFSDLEQTSVEKTNAAVELEPGVLFEHIEHNPDQTLPTESFELGAGTPEKDAENWHKQGEKYSCAVACQEFVAEQLLNRDFSEQDMIVYAEKRGWYDPEAGTTSGDVGKILESLGLQVERVFDLKLSDLAQELDSGAKIICGVNNAILMKPELAELPGQQVNHAVEVIGIEQTPSGTWVILNDPGFEGGRGVYFRASSFMKAWHPGRNYAVIARKGALSA